MTKLEHLTQYLQNSLKNKVLSNKIEAVQDTGTICPDGEDRGNGGFIVAQWRYNASIIIEEYPHNIIDPKVLLALVACWLTEFDSARNYDELGDPEVDVEVLDHEKADVVIEIELIEPIEMIPDEDGDIVYRGINYRVQTVPVYVADEMEVNNDFSD
ncbi:TPA: phage tail protein [Photobacterium damselae]